VFRRKHKDSVLQFKTVDVSHETMTQPTSPERCLIFWIALVTGYGMIWAVSKCC